MMIDYMGVTQVARYLGLSGCGTLGNYKLPPPDAMIGNTRGWLPETIYKWDANRPGKGGRPRKEAPKS